MIGFVTTQKARNPAKPRAYPTDPESLRNVLLEAVETVREAAEAGADEAERLGRLPDSVVKALDASGSNGFNWVYNNYYRKLERELVDAACGEFFSGRIGPAEFLDQCQKGADTIAQDSSIKKYKRAV